MKKLLMMGALVFMMASCSTDESLRGQGDASNLPDDAKLRTASYKVGRGDQSRVVNYAYTGSNGTRAIAGFELPTCPTDAEIEAKNPTELNESKSSDSYVIATGNYDTYINSPNQPSTLYVKGHFKGGFNGGTWTVYVLPGATFECTQDNFGSGITVYNWGHFTTSGNLSLNSNLFYSANLIEINGTLTLPNNGSYYCKEATYAKRLNVNSGSNFYSCSVFVDDEGGDNYLREASWGGYDGNATGIINFEGGNLNFQTSYIKAGAINFNSNNGLHLTLEDNGLIKTKYLHVDPNQNDQKILTSGSKAVVWATNVFLVQNPQGTVLPNFGNGVHLQEVEFIRANGNNNDPEKYSIAEGKINKDKEDFWMAPGGCNDGYNYTEPEPEPEPEDGPTLTLITDVESMDHDHDSDKTDEHRRHLSATSITFDNSRSNEDGSYNIYVSYHMRGGNWAGDTYDKDDIEGCIERWKFDGEKVVLGNYMWTDEFDFNHIILDGEKVITVGHKGGEKKVEGGNGQEYTDFGGIIARLPLYFADVNAEDYNEEYQDMEYKYLTTEVPLTGKYENPKKGTFTEQIIDYKSAGDGNCVVRVDDKYFVATSAGYGVIDSNFKRIKDEEGNVLFTSTPGSAKYLVVDEDNDDVYVLHLDKRFPATQNDPSEATIVKIGVEDFPTGEGIETATGNVISPIDGKNVIAVDKDGTVYACLSNGGLQVGEDIISADDLHGAVNGVAVDDKYIYVAAGKYLTVLDKVTKGPVTAIKGGDAEMSANFVEVKEYNGKTYVFVAFGQDGIKVYRLKE